MYYFVLFINQGSVVEAAPQAQPKTTWHAMQCFTSIKRSCVSLGSCSQNFQVSPNLKRASRSLLRQVPRSFIFRVNVVQKLTFWGKLHFAMCSGVFGVPGEVFGLLLAPFWAPFGLLWGRFGLLWLPLGPLWATFGLFGEPFELHLASLGWLLDVQRAKRVPKRVSHLIFMLYSSILLFICGSHAFSGIALFFMSLGNVVEAAPQAQPQTTWHAR